MSTENIAKFLQHAVGHRNLLEEIDAAGEKNFVATLSRVAQREGFEVSAAEVSATMAAGNSAELSEEALEAVTGGVRYSTSSYNTLSTGLKTQGFVSPIEFQPAPSTGFVSPIEF